MKTNFILLFICIINFVSSVVLAKEDSLPFELKPESDVILEILVAGPQSTEISSMFGHLGLRLKYTSIDEVQHDFALSFVANTENDTGIKRDAKGFIGFYNLNLLIETFDQYIRRTTQIENRTIHRYILNSSIQNNENLFKKLNEFKNVGLKLGNYNFLYKNCATTLYEFFSDMGYFVNDQFDSLFPISPASYSRAVLSPVMLGLIQLPRIESIGSRIKLIEIKYGFILNAEKRTDKDISVFISSLNKMTTSELNLFLTLDLSQIPGLRSHILNEIRRQKGKIITNSNRLLGFDEFPGDLYKMCMDSICASNQAKGMYRLFGKKYVSEVYIFINHEIQRSRQLIYFDKLEKTNQYIHATLLSEALRSLLR